MAETVPVAVDAAALDRAVEVLRAGGLVAFPTETVYGLGGDAGNPAAVRRIFEAKGRPADHPVIVHLRDASLLREWAVDIPEVAWRLAERFWPGPLTLILRRQPSVHDAITAGTDTVGLRVPAHPVARALLGRFGGGIAAPSANRFQRVSPTEAAHVAQELAGRVDLILDGGPCAVGVESTIVDLTSGAPAILRPGGIAREELAEALAAEVPVRSGGAVRHAGQHPVHYAPLAKVVLETTPAGVRARAAALVEASARVAVLAPDLAEELPAGVIRLSVPPGAAAMARELYRNLRRADALGVEVIVVLCPPGSGLGLAVADRLRRAAHAREEGPTVVEPWEDSP